MLHTTYVRFLLMNSFTKIKEKNAKSILTIAIYYRINTYLPHEVFRKSRNNKHNIINSFYLSCTKKPKRLTTSKLTEPNYPKQVG